MKEFDEREWPARNALRFFYYARHNPIVPWEGGFVYPKDEIHKIIKALRQYRDLKTQTKTNGSKTK